MSRHTPVGRPRSFWGFVTGLDADPWFLWNAHGLPADAVRQAEIFDMCLWVERMWDYQGHALRQQAEWRAHLPRDGSARQRLSLAAQVIRMRNG